MDIWDEVVPEFNKEINRLRDLHLGNGSAEDYAHIIDRLLVQSQVLNGPEIIYHIF